MAQVGPHLGRKGLEDFLGRPVAGGHEGRLTPCGPGPEIGEAGLGDDLDRQARRQIGQGVNLRDVASGAVAGRSVARLSAMKVDLFEDASGNEIALAPGRTWVELLPSTVPVEIVRKAPAA